MQDVSFNGIMHIRDSLPHGNVEILRMQRKYHGLETAFESAL